MDSIWSIVSIVAVFGIMYAVLIIPQRRKEKKTKAMLNAMREGDMVTSIGGVYGKVVNINEDDIIVSTSVENTQIHFKKWAIRSVEAPTTSEE
ncbi:MAG: preprotein translocase subunit YajC [Clostridia bacterium]|jgi:preprotein translocase subunit YajC|nr:preprotein translocase subunit YajC [Clostridia bacterium]